MYDGEKALGIFVNTTYVHCPHPETLGETIE